MLNFIQARTNMVDCQIHTSGIVNPLILNSFGTIPRELFVPEKLQDIAYHDNFLDIGQGRYLLDPATHAKLVQAAKPLSSDVVLDVGCGTGYSSAILSPLVSTVIALESNKKQLEKAAKLWDKIGANNIVSMEGSLVSGSDAHKPYDIIIINGAVEEIPSLLCEQLAVNGRLLTVVAKSGQLIGQAVIVHKDTNGKVSSYDLFDANAPHIAEFELLKTFRF